MVPEMKCKKCPVKEKMSSSASFYIPEGPGERDQLTSSLSWPEFNWD